VPCGVARHCTAPRRNASGVNEPLRSMSSAILTLFDFAVVFFYSSCYIVPMEFVISFASLNCAEASSFSSSMLYFLSVNKSV